jgi:hypothetical protein
MPVGWRKLIPPPDCFRHEGAFEIAAYSEFLPAPMVGWKPYGDHRVDPELFHEDDPYGWYVSEFAEARELRPGLIQVGQQIVKKLARLLDPHHKADVHNADLIDNPFWPEELSQGPELPHERCVTLLPLALSRTQDDKGRVRWTLFGSSEQGPGKAFWKGFYSAPRQELPVAAAVAFFTRLLQAVYGEQIEGLEGLRKAGFRILPDQKPLFPVWEEKLPTWTESLILPELSRLDSVKYLLTFRPFGQLPSAVRKAYLGGKFQLLPFPGSLIFWGAAGYRQLQRELPLAMQIPLLLGVARHRIPEGLRVSQSGLMHVPTEDHPHPQPHAGHVRNTFKRTHRWDKILRDEDELALIGREDKLLHVLFSTIPDDISLYDKPMARNAQIWTEDHQLLLNGPRATPEEIKHALHTVEGGGLFGYRFLYPAMRVGLHEVYWHRPLVAFRDAHGATQILPDAPLGYLTAYQAAKPRLDQAIELWPRLQDRSIPRTILHLQPPGPGRSLTPTVRSVNKLLDACQKRGQRPLPRSLARQLLIARHGQTLENWLEQLPDPQLASEVRALIEPEASPTLLIRRGTKVPDSRTYKRTATRAFEVNYWRTIAGLAEGVFLNKNNADCVRCGITQKIIPYHHRQLEDLGDFLLGYYERKIAAAGLIGKAFAGSVPFQWRTDFDFSWMGGWLKNQERAAERDLLIMIPGQDRSRAVIMADHYDTAYMTDKYDMGCGGVGARIAACGADDNHSATAAMMMAAPIFLQMSKRGQLACDIWLVHLTGEEFPADSLGARALTQHLVEGTLQLHLPDGEIKDLSGVEVKGLYVSDMIAHNNDRERDIFQISPGVDPASFWLAEQAHLATETWNASVPVLNTHPDRAGKQRGRRSPHGGAIPEIAPFLQLSGEIRTFIDPRSTLYNTDGQVFSDAGVPCVLFMENYDINRTGYHDTHDTMENIDLEYGAALCAITIESVARAATLEHQSE